MSIRERGKALLELGAIELEINDLENKVLLEIDAKKMIKVEPSKVV